MVRRYSKMGSKQSSSAADEIHSSAAFEEEIEMTNGINGGILATILQLLLSLL